MNTDRYKIYLAALLHDIGKFYQRADEDSSNRSKYISQETRNLQDQICPIHSQKGYYCYVHALYTAQFFVDHEQVFSSLFKKSGEDFSNQSLLQLSAAHHKPSTELELLIQKADWLSSGIDRTEKEGIEDAEAEHKWDSFKKVRMRSIFEMLGREKEEFSFSLDHIRPIQALGFTEKNFPKKADLYGNPEDYKDLWEQFIQEFQEIPTDNIASFLDTLLYLLEKYTSNIPSSTMHLTDVSLYDHLKTTAAFAIALFDFQQTGGQKGSDEFLFIGADLSGIQPYLYDIISKHAAKNLKGRSFFLQLFADSVLDRLLKLLELPQGNIIYSSGGGFFLLAPNTPKSVEVIERIKTKTQEYLWEELSNSLYLALYRESFNQQQLLNRDKKNDLSTIWQKTIEGLGRAKQRRFSTLIIDQYDKVFCPIEAGGNHKLDAITGEELPDGVRTFQIKTRGSSTSNTAEILEKNHKQIQMGRHLKKADYWVIAKDSIDYLEHNHVFEYSCLGSHHYLLSKVQLNELASKQRGSLDQCRIRKLNDLDFINQISGNKNCHEFTFYGGNDYPTDDEGSPLTFDQLAGHKNSENGFARLGILRMDIDNLGSLFKNGFSAERRTLSRYSCLSRGLDTFFKGYLNYLWTQNPEFNTYTQILYAGGDDLFIVGKWNVCIEFAEQIQGAFQAYVCHNPHLSISGGIAIVPPKFPISMGAGLAADAEKLAKKHRSNDREKNAMTLLGIPLNWEKEYPLVKHLKDLLIEALADQVAHSLLGKIRQHYQAYIHQKANDQTEAWRWNMAYDFSRFSKGQHRGKWKDELEKLKTAAFTNRYEWEGQQFILHGSYNFLDLLNLAARWAELEHRTN